MFKRKLTALKYFKDDVNVDDVNDFRNVIVFIEDQKIRHYKIEDREALRDIYSTNWNNIFNDYLKDIECPFNDGNKTLILDWILGCAVRFQYEDEGMNKQVVKESSKPKMIMSNPFDNFDFDDKNFKDGINQLAKRFQIPPHPNHLITLKAISLLISQQLDEQEKSCSTTKKAVIKFDDVQINTSKDPITNRCGKVLRLLHINELRNIQTKINEIIVAVQSVTANPKTDTALGQVGRM